MKLLPRAVVSLIVLYPTASLGQGPEVSLFSPQGLIKGVRQATARFSEPMVPFGDPRGLSSPFEVDCPAKGTARWADMKNWVYDFDADLPAGTRCEFRLKDGIMTLSGKALAGSKRFSFHTGGPAIVDSEPYAGASYVNEDQIFLLRLDAQPDDSSVLSFVSFEVEGIKDRVGVRIVGGDERSAILKARREETPSRPVLLVQSKQRFPSGSTVRLVWGRGVSSRSVATEQDQILAFKVRPAFTANFSCERVEAKEGCLPFRPFEVGFSAPVSWSQARKAVLRGPGHSWRPRKPRRDEDDEGEESFGAPAFVSRLVFQGNFPASKELRLELPPRLIDDAGRVLENASKFPLTVRIGDYPPLAKFSAQFGILESREGAVLPVTLRNIEPKIEARRLQLGEAQPSFLGRLFKAAPAPKPSEIFFWLKKVNRWEAWTTSMFSDPKYGIPKEFSLPKPNGAKAFEVVGIPLEKPGIYVVEIESAVLGRGLFRSADKPEPGPMFVPAMALVTNLSVHLKKGRESSLIWVTSLDKGEPVPGARVKVSDCRDAVLWEGATDAVGVARVPVPLVSAAEPRCEHGNGDLIVTAQSADDFSFVLDRWDDGIEPWRFEIPTDYGEVVGRHTIFDRTLLRAGETVHMKHLMRRRTAAGFAFVDGPPPDKMVVMHAGSGQYYVLPLQWSSGASESGWAIPKDAKLGSYDVYLPPSGWKDNGEEGGPGLSYDWISGSFRVEEFRVPLMKAVIRLPAPGGAPGESAGAAGALVAPASIPVDFMVSYLSGGGVANLPVKLRTQFRPRGGADFDAFEGFSFANGPAPEAVGRRAERGEPKIRSAELNLDAVGSGRSEAPGEPGLKAAAELLAELEFRDPNGETQTVSATVPVWPAGLVVGLKPDAWAHSVESLKFQAAVADTSGKPSAGVPVQVELLERRVYSHRKRLVGGFYAYEHSEKMVGHGVACSGTTNEKGLLACDAKPPVSGNVILQARVLDAGGRESKAHADIWVAGKGDWWFQAGDSDRMDVIPERKRYEPGDTAVFQVRMPFREATGLLVVEREGVLDAFVRKLSGKSPVVRVPVRDFYSPNVFISVLAVRGRAGAVQPTALVDLGRPSFKLGVGEIKVGWKGHELKVGVAPEREVYKVREKAAVKLKVARADGRALPAGSEAAVAAVDEGLLELMPNKSWELLEAMMGRRGDSVRTATAQMHVVGKRHFGLKALPQGGGGGRQTTRELFDTLLLWKGRVPLDSSGEAAVEIPLNDSLTSFRIAAVATGGSALFGTGRASIRTTQDLMILSGVSPLVREGDETVAHFTLRNATDKPMEVELSAVVSGGIGALAPVSAALGPGEAKELSWDISVPYGVESLGYDLVAKAKADFPLAPSIVGTAGLPPRQDGAMDRIKVSQKVVPAVPVRTFQATLAQVGSGLDVPIEMPAGSVPGRGGIRIDLKPTLAGSLAGLVEYMQRYPYGCLEQRVSKAVSLRDQTLWRQVTADLPSYLDSDGLAKYFPTMERGSEVLTSYLLSIADEAEWEIPEGTSERMAEALKGFVEGRINRYSSFPTADLTLRKLAALEALARHGKVEARMLGSIPPEPNLWPTSALLDWLEILKRLDIPDRERLSEQADAILRSRLNFQGTIMGFSTDTSDFLWWLMVSNDLNAVRAVLSRVDSAAWREDMPRLVRGALERRRRGHWDLTTANAWGRLAIEKFLKAFEGAAVSGRSRAELAGRSLDLEWSKVRDGETLAFAWPLPVGNGGGTPAPETPGAGRPAGKSSVSIRHEGTGSPWATVSSSAAIPLKEPLSSGYRIKKTVIPVERKKPGVWSRGDIARVRLSLSAQADRTWVVVTDPIPSGATILGSGLGRDSRLATQGERDSGWAFPAYQERSFEAYRAYYDFVPKGDWSLEYTVRFNNDGGFQLPTTRVEAMYSPEMFGEIPNAGVEVLP